MLQCLYRRIASPNLVAGKVRYFDSTTGSTLRFWLNSLMGTLIEIEVSIFWRAKRGELRQKCCFNEFSSDLRTLLRYMYQITEVVENSSPPLYVLFLYILVILKN